MSALGVPLGPLARLLELNVGKEARKDALAIGSRHDLGELLRQARQIDAQFVARLERIPLLRLQIRYEEIEPIRRARMEQLRAASAALLEGPWRGVRAAVRARYRDAEFETLLEKHLALYADEVQALSRAVRPALLVAPLREPLRRVMQAQASALAREVARLLHARAMR